MTPSMPPELVTPVVPGEDSSHHNSNNNKAPNHASSMEKPPRPQQHRRKVSRHLSWIQNQPTPSNDTTTPTTTSMTTSLPVTSHHQHSPSLGRSHSFPPKQQQQPGGWIMAWAGYRRRRRRKRSNRPDPTLASSHSSNGSHSSSSNNSWESHHVEFAGTQDLVQVQIIQDHVLEEEAEQVWYLSTELQQRRREDLKNHLRAFYYTKDRSNGTSGSASPSHPTTTTTSNTLSPAMNLEQSQTMTWRGLEDIRPTTSYNRKLKQHKFVQKVLQQQHQSSPASHSLARVAQDGSQEDRQRARELAVQDVESMCAYQGIPVPPPAVVGTDNAPRPTTPHYPVLMSMKERWFRRQQQPPHARGRSQDDHNHHHHHHRTAFHSLAHSITRTFGKKIPRRPSLPPNLRRPVLGP